MNLQYSCHLIAAFVVEKLMKGLKPRQLCSAKFTHVYIPLCFYCVNPLPFRPKHSTKVHVWAGISLRGPTEICIFEGIKNKELYFEILEYPCSLHSVCMSIHTIIGSCRTMFRNIHQSMLGITCMIMESIGGRHLPSHLT